MKNLYVVSCLYMNAEIITSSIANIIMNNGDFQLSKWVMTNNYWPLYSPITQMMLMDLVKALIPNVKIVYPEKNLGGHGGDTFALKHMEYKDDDYILIYDLDTWCEQKGWINVMVQVLDADPSMGFISLLHERLINDALFIHENIAGHDVVTRNPTEMWGATLFRGKVLRDGFLATKKYYGFVEISMEEKCKSLGLRHGWLFDYREQFHPIPHPKVYQDYKDEHARLNTFDGSFEEYLKAKGKS